MKLTSLLGGLAGAAALTLLNEAAKKINADAPRLDLLGQNALAKFMKGNDMISKTAKQVFPLAGDLISNSLFYGMSRGDSPSNTIMRGTLLGLSAGVGAVALPETLGLEQKFTDRTNQTKLMTIGWYVVGGLVAAAVINAIDNYATADVDNLKETTKEAGKKAARKIATEVAQIV